MGDDNNDHSSSLYMSAVETASRGLCINSKTQWKKHALVMETAQIQMLQGNAPGEFLGVKE